MIRLVKKQNMKRTFEQNSGEGPYRYRTDMVTWKMMGLSSKCGTANKKYGKTNNNEQLFQNWKHPKNVNVFLTLSSIYKIVVFLFD